MHPKVCVTWRCCLDNASCERLSWVSDGGETAPLILHTAHHPHAVIADLSALFKAWSPDRQQDSQHCSVYLVCVQQCCVLCLLPPIDPLSQHGRVWSWADCSVLPTICCCGDTPDSCTPSASGSCLPCVVAGMAMMMLSRVQAAAPMHLPVVADTQHPSSAQHRADALAFALYASPLPETVMQQCQLAYQQQATC